MGMDLQPVRPSKDAPHYPADHKYYPNEIIWGRYNWSGWSRLNELLTQWGVYTGELSGLNDGDKISNSTCLKIADAIEKHLPELPKDEQEWLQPHIQLWRTCGEYLKF